METTWTFKIRTSTDFRFPISYCYCWNCTVSLRSPWNRFQTCLVSVSCFQSCVWTYQQRGGYRLHDDPGLQFRMDEPQILEALNSNTVYELTTDEKMKLLNCLMLQILSFTTPRDEVDEKFNELQEAKSDLRNHQVRYQGRDWLKLSSAIFIFDLLCSNYYFLPATNWSVMPINLALNLKASMTLTICLTRSILTVK